MGIDNVKILVIGAGVNGSVCAVGLHKAGFDITILARGEHYKKIRDEGIVIDDQLKHKRSIIKIPVINSLRPETLYDYILVVVRKNQVHTLLSVLVKNKSPNIVFMGNNLSGPDEWIKSLGKNRVMLGFVFAAGKHEGNVIHAIMPKSRWLTTPFGEVDGTITPRLTRLIGIFRQAGFYAETSRHMIDWLATHAASLVPFAKLVMKYNLDTHALAKSTSDIGLMIDAIREILDILQATGHQITPRSIIIIRFIPRFILIIILHKLLPSKIVEMGGIWHVSQAPDEMNELIKELEILIKQSGLSVPKLKKLLELDNYKD